MRILLLTPYPPFPPRGGGALRIWNLLRGIAQHHDVTCVTFAPNPSAVAALAPLRTHAQVISVLGPPPRSLLTRARTTLFSPHPDMALRNASTAFTEALSRVLASERFDVVQAESIEMAHYALQAAPLVPITVLDQFNAEYLLQRRAALTDLAASLRLPPRPRSLLGGIYSLVQWRKLAAYEATLLRQFGAVLVVSAEDQAALRRLAPDTTPQIIPNGVDTDFFAPDQAAPQRASAPYLVFTGTLDYRPNIDALRWFCADVLPLLRRTHPELRLRIVGRAPAPAVQALHDGAAVEVVGEVPDTRPYILGAAAYVLPMRIGGGSRLKLLEALALGVPIVSTSMGAEGLIGLRHAEQVLLADTPQAMAAAIGQILATPTLAQQLGTAARQFAVQHYDWRAITPLLERVYAAARP
jgi:sugar transferase (PEP-CTERM/EpsH1 system associated)